MSGTQLDEPLTDAEVASLAQRGLLFDNIVENTQARDEALARMAAATEGDDDAMASRLDAARKHVAVKRKEMLADAAKQAPPKPKVEAPPKSDTTDAGKVKLGAGMLRF